MNSDTQQKIENTQAQMRKGILEFCVLLIIAKYKSIYASDILEKLAKSDLLVVEGTLYPLLNRLKREELLQYKWEESKSGPPRKYYAITKKGNDALQYLLKTWDELNKAITNLRK